jgi:hypothetical protein
LSNRRVKADGKSPSRPAGSERRPRTWLARVPAALASFAGGMTVNDLSGTTGYHGLAGVVALTAVVTAAAWIRTLDSRAGLPRGACCCS